MTRKRYTLHGALTAFCLYALSCAFTYCGAAASSTPDFPETTPQRARQKVAEVENVIIEAFELELKKYSTPAKQEKLFNAPVDKRRHMLSFAAFNGMGNIARWAIEKGADINKGDVDNATMLKTAVSNKNMEMVELALTLNANPDLLSGERTKMTLLSSVPSWPDIDDEKVITIIGLAKRFGARVSSEQERNDLLQRLANAEARIKVHNYQLLKEYLEKTGLHSSIPSVKGDILRDNTIHETTDRKLAEALLSELSNKLDRYVVKFFMSAGKDLFRFLIFNGFEYGIEVYIMISYGKTFHEALPVTALTKWDNSGNNALFAAIKSNTLGAVESVLKYYFANINEAADDKKEYNAFNRKARPLGIAIIWGVSDDILESLLSYTADPDLDVGSYPQLRGHLKPDRTAFDLIDEKVELGFATKQRGEKMKKILKSYKKNEL